MYKFKSRQDAEETFKNCLFEIKAILNRDLKLTSLRDRSIFTWFAKFGMSIEHLNTSRLLKKLERQKQEAEVFILRSLSRASFF